MAPRAAPCRHATRSPRRVGRGAASGFRRRPSEDMLGRTYQPAQPRRGQRGRVVVDAHDASWVEAASTSRDARRTAGRGVTMTGQRLPRRSRREVLPQRDGVPAAVEAVEAGDDAIEHGGAPSSSWVITTLRRAVATVIGRRPARTCSWALNSPRIAGHSWPKRAMFRNSPGIGGSTGFFAPGSPSTLSRLMPARPSPFVALSVAGALGAAAAATALLRPRARAVTPLPVEASAYFTEAEIARARGFRRPQLALGLLSAAVQGAVLGVLLRRPPRRGGAVLAGAQTALALDLATLPLAAVGRRRSIAVGLTTDPWRAWVVDVGKTSVVSAALAATGAGAAATLRRRVGAAWWLPGSA